MSGLVTRQVRIILHMEVAVLPVVEETHSAAGVSAQQRLLDLVLADEELTSSYCRHAAAVPLTDWLQGEPVAGLEWLRQEPQWVQDAISRLAPADQARFGPVLEGRLNGELDGFYGAFRSSYHEVQVILLS